MSAQSTLTVRTVHVDEVNDRGIRVEGEWINYSKWPKSLDKVDPGLDVEIEQDKDGYIRRLTVIEAALADAEPDDSVPPRLSTFLSTKDVLIIRQTCIKVAAAFCASRLELKSSYLLALAERLEGWVVR
jgi:hypothetical protein